MGKINHFSAHDYKWNYIVWVGATPDYYVNYKDAKRAYDEWIDEGYDDVHLYAADSKLIDSCQP